MAITQEITRIQGAKADIKSAIEAKGVSVPSNALIDTYDDYVAAIPSGGGGNQDLVDLIERDITTLTIPSGTTNIGNNAFNGCSSLTSVTIPSGTTSIGVQAFKDCSSLSLITIPSSVTSIGQYAFRGSALATITFETPSTLTGISQYMFQECTHLTSITIPSSVTSIGRSAFQGCTALTTFTCEAVNPPTLNNNIFSNTAIAHIYVPASSVETYKAANIWSGYASLIEAIPSA